MVDEVREPVQILTVGDVTVDTKETAGVQQTEQEKREMVVTCKHVQGVPCLDIAYKDFAYVDEDGVPSDEITGVGYVRVLLNDEGLRQLIEELIALLPEDEGSISYRTLSAEEGTTSLVEIHDRALSAEEIAEIHSCTEDEE